MQSISIVTGKKYKAGNNAKVCRLSSTVSTLVKEKELGSDELQIVAAFICHTVQHNYSFHQRTVNQ